MKRGYEALKKIPFGSNAMRFSIREIVMLTVFILAAGVWGIPALYRSWERVSVSDDFRLAESLRDDYWIYERCLNAPENDGKILFFVNPCHKRCSHGVIVIHPGKAAFLHQNRLYTE